MKRLLLRYSFRAYYDLGAVRTAVMSHQGFSPRRSNQRTFEKVAASSFVQRRTTRISSKEISPLACLQMEGRMMAELEEHSSEKWKPLACQGSGGSPPACLPSDDDAEAGILPEKGFSSFFSFSRSRHASKLLLGMFTVRTVCPFIPIQTRACRTQGPALAKGRIFFKGWWSHSLNERCIHRV